MKTKQVTVNIYEPGDVLDVSSTHVKLHHKKALNEANRAIIIARRELTTGDYSYIVVTDKAERVLVTPGQMQGEKYIGHVDFSMLFDETVDDTPPWD